jgi:hypothetical protein
LFVAYPTATEVVLLLKLGVDKIFCTNTLLHFSILFSTISLASFNSRSLSLQNYMKNSGFPNVSHEKSLFAEERQVYRTAKKIEPQRKTTFAALALPLHFNFFKQRIAKQVK